MDDTVNVIRPDIQEDDVAADDDMPATLGRRSQTYLKVFRHRLDRPMVQDRESYSCSDLGSDSFLGDVLFKSAMNSRPEAGMPTFP